MLSSSRKTNRSAPDAKGRRIERMKDERVPASTVSPFLLAMAVAALSTLATAVWAANADAIVLGKRIAFDPVKGNCLACHHMDDGESPGDLGPPLVAIAARFPDKSILRQHLWDPMESNPGSRMPPFGRHRILTEEEIDMVVEYIYTL
jgi:sulfur-oxidizing protein SoxX